MARIAYKYRVRYMNKSTVRKTYRAMRVMAGVWNMALKERQETYEKSLENPDIKPINSHFRQYRLIRKREHPEYAKYDAQSLQDVLIKLDSSYKSFFNLIKKDPLARPPQKKKMHRCLTYRQSGWKLERNKLYIRNIGIFRLVLHRPVIGTIKTVSITVDQRGHFFASFSCEIPDVPTLPIKKKVKIEFPSGLFIKDSYGLEIEHPRFYFAELNETRRLSRILSRRKRGSNVRKQKKYTLGKHHDHIKNKRKYFIEKIANYYVCNYDLILVPKWPSKKKIMHATSNISAMRFCDAAYSMFIKILKQAAQKSGKKVEIYALSE